MTENMPCASLEPVGASKWVLDTPALLVDLAIMEANIERMATACRKNGIRWRPHVKAIKVPAIAHMLLERGASGITCAKVSEAEVMAASGIKEILIANQIVGQQKIARLVNLRRRANVICAVDNASNVASLGAAARTHGVTLPVVIEVDMGIKRAGLVTPEACVALARLISHTEGLRFAGLMGWEGRAADIADHASKTKAVEAAVAGLMACVGAVREKGMAVDIVSCGGTGTYFASAAQPGVTEIQAGGGIFGDVHYDKHYGIAHPYALTILATVTSRPNPNRIIIDAGKKAMSGDTALPMPIGLEAMSSIRLSAEHATIELGIGSSSPDVGDKIELVCGYSDTTVHLHDLMYGTRNGLIEAVWPILGRGKLQ